MQISESEAHRDDILPNSWYIFLAATVSTPLNQQSGAFNQYRLHRSPVSLSEVSEVSIYRYRYLIHN